MYDALSLSCKHNQADFLDHLIRNGIEVFHKGSSRGGFEEFQCRIKNLRITSISDNLKIKGSLSRYYQGHNITPIPFRKIEDAVNQLSNELNVDIKKGRVTSYEVANTYEVDFNAGNYIDMFKLWKGKEPQYRNDGTLIFGSSTQVVFYDKGKELAASRQVLPVQFYGKNLLRYEFRRLRGLERQKGGITNALLVSELYSESKVKEVMKEYENGYNSVQKVKRKNGVTMSELDRKVKAFLKGYLHT